MTTATQSKLKRHPIRGALFGLLLGIGTAALLIMYAVIALGTLTPIVVIVLGVVVGVLWGMFGPAKGSREPPPSRLRTMPAATTAPGTVPSPQTDSDAETGADETMAADPFSPKTANEAPGNGDSDGGAEGDGDSDGGAEGDGDSDGGAEDD